jgi:hypothetical protein
VEDNIKTALKEIGREIVVWILMVQDRNQWWILRKHGNES